jgi:phosphomevalonate kinase
VSKLIIGVSGKQLSGKDTFAKILIDKYGFTRVSIGDIIKQEYSQQTGLTLEEIEKDKATHRPGLIKLGKEKKEKHGQDYFIKEVMRYVLNNNIKNAVITDIRLKPEFHHVLNSNGLLFRIESNREERLKRGKLVSEDDITETNLDNIRAWHCVIKNNMTIKDLTDYVVDLMKIFPEWID